MAAPTLRVTRMAMAAPVTPAPLRAAAWPPSLLLGSVGLVVSLAGLVAAATVSLSSPVRAIMVLLFALFGPGCAVVAQFPLRERHTAGALALVLSLAIFAALPTLVVWAGSWAPRTSVIALAAASLVACVVALVRHRHDALRPPRLSPRQREAWTRRTLIDLAVLAVALAAWVSALARTDTAGVGQFGLVSVLAPVYWVALVLLVAGAVTEIAQGARRGGMLTAYLSALILVVHATTPTLLTYPEYAWTYKHIGVIEYFASGQPIASSSDIYQQWPAFFTAGAQLTGASGLTPTSYAAWAPVVFNLAGSYVLYALIRTLTADRRIAFGTVLVFQSINWIEEDYLAPQGLAFILSLGVLLVVLRWLRARPAVSAEQPGVWAWLRRGAPEAPEVTERTRAWAVAATLVLMAVLTATHQLSPYLTAGSVVVLVLFGLVRPWWVAVAVAALPVIYLIPRFDSVTGAFDIFDGFNIFGNARGTATSWGTVGQAVSAVTVRTLSLVVWLLIAWIAWRNRAAFGRIIIPIILAIVPFGLLLAQSYGGEAIYRVFLFSAPWTAFLLTSWAASAWPARLPRWFSVPAVVVLLCLSLTATIQGRHGQLVVDQQDADSIAAAHYLYDHAKPGATIVLATPDFPSRLNANYAQFNKTIAVGEPDLVTGAKLTGVLDGDALPAIENFSDSFEGTTTYLVISRQMQRQAKYFGYLPDGSLDALQAALAQAPEWTVWYRNPTVTIYQLARGG